MKYRMNITFLIGNGFERARSLNAGYASLLNRHHMRLSLLGNVLVQNAMQEIQLVVKKCSGCAQAKGVIAASFEDGEAIAGQSLGSVGNRILCRSTAC